jgi:predicted nucleic acid-binding protein
MTLIDTNVILDVLSGHSEWLAWSVDQLDRCRERGPLNVNEITYAELAGRIETETELQRLLAQFGIQLERSPTSALFLAGRTFRRYRAAGGPRTTVLADFFIGAHAQVAHLPLLTRDIRRYRTYFPHVELIAP